MDEDYAYSAWVAQNEADSWHGAAESAVDEMLRAQEEADKLRLVVYAMTARVREAILVINQCNDPLGARALLEEALQEAT